MDAKRCTPALALVSVLMAPACRDAWQSETPILPGSEQSQPHFGDTVHASSAPPPISGGTLAIARDGTTAVAADPDRDRIYLVDLASKRVVADLALQAGDEPGRVIEAGDHQFYVALRRGGAIVGVDTTTRALTTRTSVCARPRGVAADVDRGLVHVACAGGELVSIRTADQSIARTLDLDDDLRDVVLSNGVLYVTRFRSAEGFEVGDDGVVSNRWRPVGTSGRDGGVDPDASVPDLVPSASVAWRAVAAPGGGVLVAHQFASNATIPDDPSDADADAGATYGGRGCGGIVSAAVTWHVGNATRTAASTLIGATLPVDVAAAHRLDRIVMVAAGNSKTPNAESLYTLHAASFDGRGGCGLDNEIMNQPNAQPTAVAFTPDDRLVVQTREPASLYLVDSHEVITLSTVSREDTGHAIFHANAGIGMACASCHPEGGDDGRVWTFSFEGRRRTQSLAGGIASTAPFHWDGALSSMSNLSSQIFSHRMGGPSLTSREVEALEQWIDAVPRNATDHMPDAASVERGRVLFNDANVACASCHAGDQGTNNQSVDVGTGGAFQVPRLVGLAARAPYMHNGCAATLRDRFGVCGGGDRHGHTSQLTSAQIDDLVAYLRTL